MDWMTGWFEDIDEWRKHAKANFEESVKESTSELKRRIKRMDAKEAVIKELEWEYALLRKDVCEFIKKDLIFSDINVFGGNSSNMLYDAFRWQANMGNADFARSVGEETAKKCEVSYDYVTSTVKRNIMKDDEEFEFADITEYNYGDAYIFEYRYKGIPLQIAIMNFERANYKNLRDFLEPYSVSYEESKNCWHFVCADANYAKIHDKIVKWYEEMNGTKEEKEEASGNQKRMGFSSFVGELEEKMYDRLCGLGKADNDE